jgi:hypothetical protein
MDKSGIKNENGAQQYRHRRIALDRIANNEHLNLIKTR